MLEGTVNAARRDAGPLAFGKLFAADVSRAAKAVDLVRGVGGYSDRLPQQSERGPMKSLRGHKPGVWSKLKAVQHWRLKSAQCQRRKVTEDCKSSGPVRFGIVLGSV